MRAEHTDFRGNQYRGRKADAPRKGVSRPKTTLYGR
jgi:hypothetical protein